MLIPVICDEQSGCLPKYAKPGDAGMDGIARLYHNIIIPPGGRALVPLGIKCALPAGFEIQVRPRSGLALKNGLTVLNSPGTVDESFRGEIGAIVINHGTDNFTIAPGDRICQLVLNRVETIEWLPVEELPTSERGEGGFGHTGK